MLGALSPTTRGLTHVGSVSSAEEAGHVAVQHQQGLLQVLEDSDHGEAALHDLLGPLQPPAVGEQSGGRRGVRLGPVPEIRVKLRVRERRGGGQRGPRLIGVGEPDSSWGARAVGADPTPRNNVQRKQIRDTAFGVPYSRSLAFHDTYRGSGPKRIVP